jgi:hypothetical protein
VKTLAGATARRLRHFQIDPLEDRSPAERVKLGFPDLDKIY